MDSADARLFVCYIPGLDRRLVDAETMPWLSRSLTRYPHVEIHTQPTTELFSTLLTGTNPQTHEIWQVRLKDDIENSATDKMLDRLPDWLTTTWQCFRHLLHRGYDLPAMPR